jgi:hypothetical protein
MTSMVVETVCSLGLPGDADFIDLYQKDLKFKIIFKMQ